MLKRPIWGDRIQIPYVYMNTKTGIKLYIASIRREIDESLRMDTLRVKMFRGDLAMIRKRKDISLSDKLRIEDLSKEIKKSLANIALIKKQKNKITCKSIENGLNRLKKHPNIIGVEAMKDGFDIYTKPLTVKRKQIGNYEINLSYKYLGRIRIYNLYKGRDARGGADHWFIEDGIPCLGTWGRGVRKYAHAGNIYLLVDTLIRFLTSSYRSDQGYMTFDKFIEDYL